MNELYDLPDTREMVKFLKEQFKTYKNLSHEMGIEEGTLKHIIYHNNPTIKNYKVIYKSYMKAKND
jgi:uncharacterized protein YerC